MDPVLLLLELGASGLGHDEDLSVFTDQIRDVSRAVSCTYVLLTVYRTQSDSVLTFATPSRRNPSSRLSGSQISELAIAVDQGDNWQR